ncbi:MAG: hypothetical protein RMK64_10790 [Rhodovarius sp.]|nr:hypothetical protein [Rhodovarius sp.]MDW8315446.1 hypothetical protein [Rhodovarius sp.]
MRILAWLLILLGLLVGFVFSFGEPLGALIFAWDQSLLPRLQAGVQRYLLPWMWDLLFLPILERPAWVAPVLGGCFLFLLRWLIAPRPR